MKLHIVKFSNGKYGAYRKSWMFGDQYFKYFPCSNNRYFIDRSREHPHRQEFDSIEELKSEIKKHLGTLNVDLGELVEVWKI